MAGTEGTRNGLQGVKHIIMVLSGKGGVGKSTVACQLALTLAHQYQKQVGLLDVDICGPSVPKIVGLEGEDVFRDADGWRPVSLVRDAEQRKTHDLKVMSIAYLLPSDKDAVVWRGPKKDAMIKQFVTDVHWGELDYLVIDTPPGTSDEHLTLCEVLASHNPTGAVIVTTPQDVATDDVKKELSFCHKLGVRCLGVVENMSGFACPYCAHCTDIFSRGGGRALAERYEVAFLGEIAIDPSLSLAEDHGEAFTQQAQGESSSPPNPTVQALKDVVEAVLAQVRRVEGSGA